MKSGRLSRMPKQSHTFPSLLSAQSTCYSGPVTTLCTPSLVNHLWLSKFKRRSLSFSLSTLSNSCQVGTTTIQPASTPSPDQPLDAWSFSSVSVLKSSSIPVFVLTPHHHRWYLNSRKSHLKKKKFGRITLTSSVLFPISAY